MKNHKKFAYLVTTLLVAFTTIDMAQSGSRFSNFQRKNLMEDALRLNQPSLQAGLDDAKGRITKRKMPEFLRIHSAPPSETIVSVNENAELKCEVSGSPPPSIHWLKNGEPVAETIFESEETSNKIAESELLSHDGVVTTSSSLKLDCADFDTEGIYTCVAESLIERVISSTYVHVEGMSPYNATICKAKQEFESSGAKVARISMWFSTYVETQGKDAVLACRVTGNPRPHAFWLNGEGRMVVDSKKYQVLPNGDLKIRSLAWDDMGGYTCVAENKYGRDEVFTFLYPLRPDS